MDFLLAYFFVENFLGIELVLGLRDLLLLPLWIEYNLTLITLDFLMEIDINLWSVLFGGLVSLLVVLIYEWITKPRLRSKDFNFIVENFNLGYRADPGKMYKLKFKVRGRRSPGFCEIQIHWNGDMVRAKWDHLPNPLIQDSPDEFEPSIIPRTFNSLVLLGEIYSVPLINEDNNGNLTIFDGWWFGKRLGLGYGPDPTVDEDTELRILLIGSELAWSKTITVRDIMCSSQ